MTDIAIIGMACEYPDASTPGRLWENVLAGRRAFRPMPAERLNPADYYDADPKTPDKTYIRQAAVIEGYRFDRVGFRVSGHSFRTADMTHWLALDVVARAFEDAGYPDAQGLPRDETGVLLGNSLTGEFSRAGLMRLRWPYVRRVVSHKLEQEGWSPEDRAQFLARLEADYKQPFPGVNDESLAGGLANTIAGRICNHFDLHGGGYTVDGACSSSLLSVCNACSSLTAGDLDVAVAGGIDLSLDPFELVGFAKTGALTKDMMRVYDKNSAGFLPGEGCGILILRRLDDALEAGDRIYSVIRGWGISSDGKGGLTRPESDGQLLSLKRAYRRAGIDPATVGYFEGHGTGTAVGDETELRTLIRARGNASFPAALGSIKANIGHTKAAAGAAALIKAVMALHHQIIPPTTGCEQPHHLLEENADKLATIGEGMSWPQDRKLRAGVSAMGFGGINTHIALEAPVNEHRRVALTIEEQRMMTPPPECELFAVSAETAEDLRDRLTALIPRVEKLSRAELTDLAAYLSKDTTAPWRAAVLAAEPEALVSSLTALADALAEGKTELTDTRNGRFLGYAQAEPTIGFLFSGQAAPVRRDPGYLGLRYRWISKRYETLNHTDDSRQTQSAIALASSTGWELLDLLGLHADHAVGHSLGELTALNWAGGIDAEQLDAMVTARADAMFDHGREGGMTAVAASPEQLASLLEGDDPVIACYNGPHQTILSGSIRGLESTERKLRTAGLKVTRLDVTHGFHSPLLADAADIYRQHLTAVDFRPHSGAIYSTVYGEVLQPGNDPVKLLTDQFHQPVRFHQAFTLADQNTDLWIEVGPGAILAKLAARLSDTPAVATDMGNGMRGVLSALAAAHVAGASLDLTVLFTDRFTRPFNPHYEPEFLASPCEAAPELHDPVPVSELHNETEAPAPDLDTAHPLILVKQLVALRAEFPVENLEGDMRLLDDLHLSSIAVAELVAESSRSMKKVPPKAPTELANASLAELAETLNSAAPAGEDQSEEVPEGVTAWIHCFQDQLPERPLPAAKKTIPQGKAQLFGPRNLPLMNDLNQREEELGAAVVCCLPAGSREGLLQAAKALLRSKADTRFVLVQEDSEATPLARTLNREAGSHPILTVTLPFDSSAPQRVIDEVAALRGYRDVIYDAEGIRRVPVLHKIDLKPDASDYTGLGPEDVVLVSGGGKGITAECALKLHRNSGAALILLGRANPDEDRDLAANLHRFTHLGVRFTYRRADVADAQAVASAVEQAQKELGPVTAVLHGAGRNNPVLLSSLSQEELDLTYMVKVGGLQNILDAVDASKLKLVIGFGSIIARCGLEGEGHYALANQAMERLLDDFAVAHPACRCLNMAWSVWSGVGMGERLGTVQSLRKAGITPITTDIGLHLFGQLLADPNARGTVVIAGRFGAPRTVEMATTELPFLRFLEKVRVHYPGIEMVIENKLSTADDPYLNDHLYENKLVFPAVMGMEAMSQAVIALTGREQGPNHMTDLELARPVIVPKDAPITIRTIVQTMDDGSILAVIRSEETAFGVDHFRARFHYMPVEAAPETELTDVPAAAVPADDFYGPVFFHSGRFQRVSGYRRLHAYECLAEITPTHEPWFGRLHPAELAAGDPGMRDAVLHAILACIPHKSVLPLSVASWTRYAEPKGACMAHAVELKQEGHDYHYRADVLDADGKVIETWRGLVFREIHDKPIPADLPAALIGPYLQRILREKNQCGRLGLIVEPNEDLGKSARSQALKDRLSGLVGPVTRRGDGKPCIDKGNISFAHTQGLSLASWGEGELACDVERVVGRSGENWKSMLNGHARLADLLAAERSESTDLAATRLWCARECLVKAGRPLETPLTLLPENHEPGLVCFAAGETVIATLAFKGATRIAAVLFEGKPTPAPAHT
ncbi:MAG: SDR family NAD(P)-dependent oxidoreductase [Acidobacteriota bacterium]|nr:SDR family NAD(P)-dependent oxidoreductase [Acidobacteriota bacterium]